MNLKFIILLYIKILGPRGPEFSPWREDSIDRDSLYFYTLVRQGDPSPQRSISKRLPYIEIDSPSNRLNPFFMNPAATYVVGEI
jgi:hypothetical protein